MQSPLMELREKYDLTLVDFYLFFNIGSGCARATQFLIVDLVNLAIQVENYHITLHFYSIQSKSSRDVGYKQLKTQTIDKRIPVVIAGGDGTTMWVIEQMLEHDIDLDRIILIPMPCGTGNDFSMSLGWGSEIDKDLFGSDYRFLKQYILDWNKGEECMFDIWDITIETNQNGYIQEVIKQPNGFIKQTLKVNGVNQKRFEKKMANYFSIGVDARIGYGFDKRRTTNRCCNKCCYCFEGFKKMFLKTKKINEIIQYMATKNTPLPITLFRTRNCNLDQQMDSLIIPNDPINLVALNINSYSAGTTDIWRNAKNPYPICQFSDKVSFSDGKLEFFSFNSILGIGSEKIMAGNAMRLAQTGDPLEIGFTQNGELETYFQMDGQYYSIVNPLNIQIVPCRSLPNGKIRVIRKQ